MNTLSADERAASAAGADEETTTLPVIEESVHVAAAHVDQGGYRITKTVETRQQIVEQLLRHRHVTVERRPLGVLLPEGCDMPEPHREGDVLVIPVVEEVLVTTTRLRIVEEVHVTIVDDKQRSVRPLTLLKEAIRIERLGADLPRPGRHEPAAIAGQGSNAPSRASEEKAMSSIVVGMFDSEAAATRARAELVAAGFASAAVSVTGGSGSTTTRADTSEGGVSGWFKSLFGDDDGASRSAYTDTYGEALRRGGYGVSVETSDDAEADQAESVLNRCGAVDIDEKSRGWTGASGDSAATVDAGQPRKLQELEEELKVGKRAVARGGVRIFSRVTEIPVSETVRLREERADVKWTPVDRPATEADFTAFKEGSIEIRESAEEAVVGKTARVVGEVSIGKTVTEREETVRDTVRKTTVDVERIEGGDAGAGTSLSGNGDSGTNGSPNRDPLSGAPGAHPVGTAVGAAAGGMAAGAVVGTVAGPVGTAVGAAVGAVAGGLAGKSTAEAVDPTTPGAKPNKKTP